MFNDSFIMAFLSNMLRIVPTLLVCVGGIVIMQTRVLPKNTKTFGISGLALLLLNALASVAFSTFLGSGGIDYAGSNFRVLQLGYGAVSQVVYSIALILLVMAICNKQQATIPKSKVENPYAQ